MQQVEFVADDDADPVHQVGACPQKRIQLLAGANEDIGLLNHPGLASPVTDGEPDAEADSGGDLPQFGNLLRSQRLQRHHIQSASPFEVVGQSVDDGQIGYQRLAAGGRNGEHHVTS